MKHISPFTGYLVRDINEGSREKSLLLINDDTLEKALQEFYTGHFMLFRGLSSLRVARSYDIEPLTMIDGKKADKSHYCVLSEYAGKDTLEEKLCDLTQGHALDVFAETCAALHYLHSKLVIYGELNPRNIIVNEENGRLTVKLRDLATVWLCRKGVAGHGDMDYTAPEIIYDNNRSVHSDIYSLGVLLFNLIFKGSAGGFEESLETVKTVEDDEFSQKIIKIIEKATAGYDKRYESVVSLLDDINTGIGTNYKAYELPEMESFAFRTEFFGRDVEIANIFENFDKVMGDTSSKRHICVYGESGIGKTTLLNVVKNRLYIQNMPVFWAIGTEGDMAIQAILRQMLGVVSDMDMNSGLIQYIISVASGAAGKKLDFDRTSIIKFMFDCVKDKHVVMIIDNLEKADDFTIGMLERLMSVCGKLVLVYSYQYGNDNEKLMEFKNKAEENGTLIDMELAPLSEADTALLIRRALSYADTPEIFASHVYRNAYGNPRFTEETLITLHLRGTIYIADPEGRWETDFAPEECNKMPLPESIEQAVKEQASRYDEESLEVLTALSVCGKMLVTERFIETLLPHGFDKLGEKLAMLVRDGVIRAGREDRVRYGFVNMLLKNHIYEKIGKRAKELHAQAAEFLITTIPKPGIVVLDEILYHLETSGQDGRLPEYYNKAADECLNVKDIDKAGGHYTKAADICERLGDEDRRYDFLMKLGKGLLGAKKLVAAFEIFSKAVEISTNQGQELKEADACIELSTCYIYRAEQEKAREYIDRAGAYLEKEDREIDERYVRFLNARSLYLRLSQDVNYLEFLNRALEMCPEELRLYKAYFHDDLANHYLNLGQSDKAVFHYTQAINLLEGCDNAGFHEQLTYNLAVAHVNMGNQKMHNTLIQELYEKAQTSLIQAAVLHNMGSIYVDGYYDVYKAIEYWKAAYYQGLLTESTVHSYDRTFTISVNLAIMHCNAGLFTDVDRYMQIYRDLMDKIITLPQDMIHCFVNETDYLCYGKIGEPELALSLFKTVTDYYSKENSYFPKDSDYTKARLGLINIVRNTVILTKCFTENAPCAETDKALKEANDYLAYLISIINVNTTILADSLNYFSLLGRYGRLDSAADLARAYIEKANDFDGISQVLKAKIGHVEGFLVSGEDRVNALLQTYRDSKETNLHITFADVCKQLSDYYDSNRYLSLYYCLHACEAVQRQLLQTPEQHRPALVKTYDLYAPFEKLMLMKKTGSVAGKSPADIIMGADLFDNLPVDGALIQQGRETYLSELPFNITDADDIFKCMSDNALENLDLIAKHTAAMACARKCQIISDADGEFKVHASSDRVMELPDVAILNRVKIMNSDIVLTKDINAELLPPGVKAAACVRVRCGEKTVGYVYVQSDNLLHNISKNTVEDISRLLPLCGMNITLLNIQEGAMLDKLSRVLNRKYLELSLDHHIDKAKATGGIFSIIILDIDKFKGINDTFGHRVGDTVIQSLGKLISNNTRKDTAIGRYGGEEFVIILDNTASDNALKTAEKLRSVLEESRLLGYKRPVTASFGIASYGEHGVTKAELIRKADMALYICKERGRNRCEVYDASFETVSKITNITKNLISGDAIKDAMRIRVMLEFIELTKYKTGIGRYLEKIKELAEAETCEFNATETSGETRFVTNDVKNLSTADIPVTIGGVVAGSLHLSAPATKRRYNKEDVDFARQLGDLMSFAM